MVRRVQKRKPSYVVWWVGTLLVFIAFGVFVGNRNGKSNLDPLESEEKIIELEEADEEFEKNNESLNETL